MAKIVVPISDDERILLVKLASQNLRHPRDQARYILRSALGLNDTAQENNKPVGCTVLADTTTNGFLSTNHSIGQ